MTSKINHSGDGETVSFSFPFFIPAKTALEVRVGGAIRAEGFNIVGAACPEGGKVVFDAPPATGEQVSLRYRGGVSVTVDDSTFGHLADKLVGGANVTVTAETLDGGVQKLRIDAAASDLSKSVADGLYLAKLANLSDVHSKETARDNLGVTTAISNAVTPLNTAINSLGNSVSTLNTSVTSLNGTVTGLSADALMKAKNLLDVPNKENALANLGVTSAIANAVAPLNAALTGVAYLTVAQDWTKPQRSQAVQTAEAGGSVALDFAQYQNFDLTLTADITFANPTLTAAMVGQKGTIGIVPNGHAITNMGTLWKRVGETGSPSEITGYGRIDYHVRSTSRIEYAYNDVEA